MAVASKTPLTKFRGRMKRLGAVRVEVKVERKDAELVRAVAQALGDPDRRDATRALLQRELTGRPNSSLKNLLARAPLDGVELTRSRRLGLLVDL